MNKELSKRDLAARILNTNIHNHCMFLFASMIKRCALGNYYEQRHPFSFREANINELNVCDGLFYDDYGQSLVVEVKTRIIKDSHINVIDSIKTAITMELKEELFNNYFIVPVFMYTASDRDLWDFREAKIMMHFGNQNHNVWTKAYKIKEWYECIKLSTNIAELFDYMISIDNNQLELPVITLDDQAKSEPPKISRYFKTRYFYIRYNEHIFNGINHIKDIMIGSKLYPLSFNNTEVRKSLARLLYAEHINIVVKYRDDMINIEISAVVFYKHPSGANHKRFTPEYAHMIDQSELIIIINNPSINDLRNKQDLHIYNEYMDTLGLDGLEVGSVSG
jgi:hypothetical protein